MNGKKMFGCGRGEEKTNSLIEFKKGKYLNVYLKLWIINFKFINYLDKMDTDSYK